MDEVLKLTKALEKSKQETARIRDLNNKIVRNSGLSFEISIDELKEFLTNESAKIFKAKFVTPPAHKSISSKSVFDPNHSEVVVLPTSDWHVAEKVHPLEVNGMNIYNPMVLSNRLWDLAESAMQIIRGHQSMYKIEKLWLPILGDMVSGSIHPELVLTNALLDLPSAVLAARLLILYIERLKTLGLPIEADAVVGNHGRLLAKMPTKKQAHTSLDWMVYVMVEEYFRNDPQVTFYTHTSQFALVKQFEHRFILEHTTGFARGKMRELESRLRNIFDNQVYREATGMTGTSVDYVIGADKHNYERGSRYTINGTIVGSSELTTSWRLPPIPAEQAIFGMSRKHPATWGYPIDVTDTKSEQATNPFSKYTQEFMEIHGH